MHGSQPFPNVPRAFNDFRLQRQVGVAQYSLAQIVETMSRVLDVALLRRPCTVPVGVPAVPSMVMPASAVEDGVPE